MIRFANPWWLLLALAVAARMALLIRDRRRRFGAFVVSSLALVAPARPQRVTRTATNDRYGIDIVIALDASGSMAAEDFRPRNRFAVAKDLIGDFVAHRVDDRIGIVIFGARAATRVPITYDRDVAQSILDKAQESENSDGTAIGSAIATAVN